MPQVLALWRSSSAVIFFRRKFKSKLLKSCKKCLPVIIVIIFIMLCMLLSGSSSLFLNLVDKVTQSNLPQDAHLTVSILAEPST